MSLSYNSLVFNILLFSIMIASIVFTIFLYNSNAAKKNEKNKQISRFLILLTELPVFYIFIKYANLVDSKIAFPLVLLMFILSFGGKGTYLLYKLYKADKDIAYLLDYYLYIF